MNVNTAEKQISARKKSSNKKSVEETERVREAAKGIGMQYNFCVLNFWWKNMKFANAD